MLLLGTSVMAMITSVLAFLLPLKVILLAGSSGVPRYFRFFIEEADRNSWIMILAGGAVAAYFMTIALEAMSRKLAALGSLDVLAGANDLAVIRDHRVQAQTYYGRFAGMMAGFILAFLFLSALPLLDMTLFRVVLALIAIFFLVTALAYQKTGNDGRLSRLSRLLESKFKGYLGTLSSILFFAGFFVLLYPFLWGEGGNILLAIVAFLMLRRMLQALEKSITVAVSLWQNRMGINPLLFPNHQVRQLPSRMEKNLRLSFSQQRRKELAERALMQHEQPLEVIDLHWRDPLFSRLNLFDISARTESGESRYFQMQVFPQVGDQGLENEQFLFDVIPRDELLAPRVFQCIEHDSYEVQICHAGSGKGVSNEQFKNSLPELRKIIWGVAPPKRLVKAYKRSHMLLAERCDEETMRRMELAMDTPADRKLHDALMERLADIQEILSAMPLAIQNPDIQQRNVYRTGRGNGVLIMSWARWSLEPVGAGISGPFQHDDMAEIFAALCKKRSDMTRNITLDHLHLAQRMWVLERTLSRMAFRVALGVVASVLENPLLTERP